MNRAVEPELRFRFGDFEYCPRYLCLSRSNRPVKIGSRALLVLDRLLQDSGSIVPGSDLEQSAWPETHVDPSNLRVQISHLRATIDIPHERSCIANIPGRGYVFVAPIERIGGTQTG